MSPPSSSSFQDTRAIGAANFCLGLPGRSGAKLATVFCAFMSGVLFGSEHAWGDDRLIQIGRRKQLFVDDYVVAEKSGVTRVLGTVTKENGGKPILLPDKPWENAPYQFGFYVTVLREGGKFKMWYRPNSPWIAYAESADGKDWKKPDLGIYNLDGKGKANNLTDHIGDGFSLFRDPHEKDPAHRYKGAYCPTVEPYGACLTHSADGLRWTPYHHGKPVTHRAADFSNQILWDDQAKVYLLFTRTDYGPGGGPEEIRGVRIMSNPDIKANPTNWTTISEWRFNREGHQEYKRRQIYHFNDWIYEGVHFGLMLTYDWPLDMSEGGADHVKRHERDTLSFYLVPSRDARNWDLSWVYAEKPLIPRGPDGSYDKDMVVPAFNILTVNDRHWIYYTGNRERHSVDVRWPMIGLATLRLDGFVGLEAGNQPGEILTKPFLLKGSKLKVNVEAPKGEWRVELLDQNGRAIEGFAGVDAQPYRGTDSVRFEPQWKKGLRHVKDKPVRLKFHLLRARLYAFQVE